MLGDWLTEPRIRRFGADCLLAVLSVATAHHRRSEDYHPRLRDFSMLSRGIVVVHAP
jgi:hypothetical protein